MEVNLALKAALIERYATQIEASKAMEIAENRLSYIVRRHVEPNERELKALEKGLGRARVRELLIE